MKRKNFYIIMSVILVILIILALLLFFVFFRCSRDSGSENGDLQGNGNNKIDVDDGSSTAEETGGSDDETDDENIDEEDKEEDEDDDEKEAPTIKLEVYEGPLYSAGDDICYYRVKAVVEGSPEPEVSFNKDDSNGAWGDYKVQINISRGETFTLVGEAANSEGTASDSINLDWGCGDENRPPEISSIVVSEETIYTGDEYDISVVAVDPDGDPLSYHWTVTGGVINDQSANPIKWLSPAAPDTYTIEVVVSDDNGAEDISELDLIVNTDLLVSLPRVESEGGYIEYGGLINNGGCLFAGDSEFENLVRGFISFDISSLSDVEITGANLVLNMDSLYGDPSGFGNLNVIKVYWGENALAMDDFGTPGVLVTESGSPDFSYSGHNLKDLIQEAVNNSDSRVQLMLMFILMGSDGEGDWDGWEYEQSSISLNITYH